MAEWKKVIVSGSNAELNQVTASYFSGDGSALTNVPAGSINIESFTDGTGIGSLSKTVDKLLISDNGVEKYVTVGQLPFTVNTNTQLSDSQVRSKISATGNSSYNSTTGVITSTDTNTQLSDTYVIGLFSGGTNVTLDASTGEITSTDTNTQLSDSQVRSKFTGGTNVSITAGGVISSTNTNTQLSQEQVEDMVAELIVGGTNVTSTYNDSSGTLTLSSTDTNTTSTADVRSAGALMDDEVTNLVDVKAFDTTDYATSTQGTKADAALPKAGGAMTGAITTNSTFDGRDVATDGSKLDDIEVRADVTDTANVVAALTAGTNVSIAANGTISSTDTNTNTGVDMTVATLKTKLAGSFGSNALTIGDSTDIITIGNNLVVTGDLTVSGTTTTVDTANLSVTDQFIELNDGGAAGDAGIVVNLAADASMATAFGYDHSEGRWAFDARGASATQTAIDSDAFAVSVHVSAVDGIAGVESVYQKAGNMHINASDEIFIYV